LPGTHRKYGRVRRSLWPSAARRPSAWGARLTLACELTRGGFPSRPDSAREPERFAQWAQKVTRTLDVYDTVAVTTIGATAGVGKYEGSFSQTGRYGSPWTGFIQAAGGFSTNPGYDSQYLFANFGAFYNEFSASMIMPYAYGCEGSSCATMFTWAGIGGWTTLFFSEFVPDLMQGGSPTRTTRTTGCKRRPCPRQSTASGFPSRPSTSSRRPTQVDSSDRPCSIPVWSNGTVSEPEDPMYFIALTCGPT
jgi:hypothetical protein